MNTIKYLLECICVVLGILSGASIDGKTKEMIIGTIFAAFVILIFNIWYVVLDKRTKLFYNPKIYISILLTAISLIILGVSTILIENLIM